MTEYKETKFCSKCRFEKDRSEFHKNKARYDGLNNFCKPCAKVSGRKYRQEHPEKNKERCDRWRFNNRDKWNEISRKYREENPEYYEQYFLENADRERVRKSQWKKDNPHKVQQYNAKRRASERNATPLWADEWIINEIYELSVLRSEMTGIEWHVDHIVPLISDVVCGLHTEHNLRVITAAENYKKNNRFTI